MPDIKHIELDIQPDGNWIGTTKRKDQDIKVRDISPDACLQRLLTHE